MRSRTAGVMMTLMRNGRDRRSGKPVKCHARKERVRLFGTRSADYIRASGQSGRPNGRYWTKADKGHFGPQWFGRE